MTPEPNDFWYTPPYVLDCIRDFMPKYFDPCPINPIFDGLGKDDDGSIDVEYSTTCREI